jgi:flagellar motor switch protein FliN/FliY
MSCCAKQVIDRRKMMNSSEQKKVGKIDDVKVPLQIQLGETEATVKEMAGIGVGTIIELDKLAGEPVDLLAAGERIARGEVVVIDENFGIRITEMIPEEE